MAKEYVVIASGTSKKTGALYSLCAAISNSANGQFLSDRDRVMLDDVRPVGEKVMINQTVAATPK